MIDLSGISFKKKIALDLYSVKRKLDTFTHDLRYLFWECTLRCNLNCLHCGSDCALSSETVDMPKEDFLRVLDDIKSTSHYKDIAVCLTGGEPLMRKDLADAGSAIADRGYRWGIVTNGMLLTEKRMEELLKARIGSMAISLDGLSADHNWFRGHRDAYRHALRAIDCAVNARNTSQFFFDVVTCVNQRNITSLEKIRELLVTKGVKHWRLLTIFPKGRASAHTELALSGEKLHTLLQYIKKVRCDGTIDVSYGCEGFLGSYEMEVRDTPFFCRAGVNIGSVLIDGSISACPSLRNDFIQGNIYKERFSDVWEKKFRVMRNRNWALKGECKKCSVWHHCQGNSLHLRSESTGELLYCSYMKLQELQVSQ